MKELRIKDICDKDSSNLKQKDVEGKNGQYPVYGASGIISHIDTYHQENNYIAIVKDGSGIGRVTFMPAKSSVIGTMQYILPKEGFNITYIGYCLQSLDLSKYKQGAAIPHIYFRDYGERIVKVTEDIKEQQRIVDYLDAAFAKIDAMKANAEKALSEAKALFQASLKEMLEPKEGWEYKKLGEVCKRITDGSHNPPKGIEKSHNYMLSSQNVQNGYLDMSSVRYLSDEDFRLEDQRTQAKNGDVLLTIVGTIGRTCVLDGMERNITFQRSVAILKPSKEINSHFLMYFLLSQNSKLNAIAHGAAQKGIYLKQLENVELYYPPLSEQQSIVAALDSLKSKVDQLQENYDKISQECDALKQAILKQVFE